MAKVAAVDSGLICLLLIIFGLNNVSVCKAADNWQRFPTLDTFASYEDMQHYFDQRNLRSMRHIENPNDDSYLAAFNQYNEQPVNPLLSPHPRVKREERQLPSAPRMLRFEVSDAVEPSKELKQLLRQLHDRALKTASAPAKVASTIPALTRSSSTPKPSNKKTRKPRRLRRSTSNRQPANFKVQMIPFEVTDAREPDEITAKLIQRARALDFERRPSSVSGQQSPKQSKRKSKRSKRSAPQQVLKFELADAKTSLPASFQRNGKNLNQPSLLTMEMATKQSENQTKTSQEDNMVQPGETAAESKRMYIYKEAPLKTKKSISSLPHEVQKVISQLIKDGNGGKAYIKYLQPQKTDFEHYRAKTISYVPKPTAYIKYVAAKPVADPVHVHIQPVPVVEQLRFVYKPVYQTPPTIQQPIVVQETAQAVEQVHHTYAAHEPAQVALPEQKANILSPQFRPSKPDPLLESSPVYGRPIENFQYEVPSEPNPTQSPLIKIEYHAPADNIKEHYKQMPEFQALSTLIGKSPDDQIHGLTYLLAKEMQAKLQRQPKQLLVAQIQANSRPQDSTAPILFHPGQQEPAPVPASYKIDHNSLGVQPGRLIGMAKTKQYVPIVEAGNNDVKELPSVASNVATKLPTPSSFIDFIPGHGLSHGYEGVRNEQPLTTVEHIVHHPMHQLQQQQHHHHQHNHQQLLATSLPAHVDEENIGNELHYDHSHDDKALHQYASKYAFGYRIRDFHTGNDFGHKQNRDLHGVTRGQYHILLPDGRVQNVIYHADDTGFHADVSFESGTTTKH